MTEEEELHVLEELLSLLHLAQGDWSSISSRAQAIVDDAAKQGMAVRDRLILHGQSGLPLAEWGDWEAYVDAFMAEIGCDSKDERER